MDQEKFVKQAKAQMDNWAGEMRKMQDQMVKAAGEGQAQMQAQMKEQFDAFNTQRKEAEKVLEDMGKANMEAWKDMQAGVESAWKALEDSFTEAQKRYKK